MACGGSNTKGSSKGALSKIKSILGSKKQKK